MKHLLFQNVSQTEIKNFTNKKSYSYFSKKKLILISIVDMKLYLAMQFVILIYLSIRFISIYNLQKDDKLILQQDGGYMSQSWYSDEFVKKQAYRGSKMASKQPRS